MRRVAKLVPPTRFSEAPADAEWGRFFELSGDLFCVMDRGGRLLSVSCAFTRTLGHEVEDLAGRRLIELVHEDDVDHARCEVADLPDGGAQRSFPTRCRTASGAYRVIEWTARAGDEDGRIFAVGRDVTADARLRERLRASEQRLKLVLQAAAQGVWDWIDVERPDQWWSPRFYDLLGVAEGAVEPTYDNFLGLLHPDDRDQVAKAVRDHLDGDRKFDIECRFQHASGGYRWFRVRAVASTGDDGRARRMTGCIVDVTERRFRENEMRKLAQIVHRTTNGVLLTDVDGGAVWVNEAFVAISGKEPQALDGKTIEEILLGPEPGRREAGALSEALARREPVELDLPCVRQDGQDYWARVRTEPIVDPSGSLVGLLAVMTDITEQKEAQEKLQRSEELLQITGELANIGGWELDLETMAPHWSSQVYRIHECDPDFQPTYEEALGFYPEEAIQVQQQAVEQALRRGESWDLELPFVTAKGRRRWVRSIGRAVYEDGKPVRLAGSLQDITDRKVAEEKLTRTLNDVEESRRQISKQAKQLAFQTEELTQAREEALESARLKTAFLANMSHEIRTPMNGVIGMVQVLEGTEVTAEQQEYLHTIRLSSEALLTIIDDILDLSKIEAGKMTFERIPLDLVECVEEAAELLVERAAERELDLSTYVHSDLRRMRIGDPHRLRQILLNLIGNAVKFTHSDYVAVRALPAPAEGPDHVRFEVEDTGAGVSADVLTGLFQPFTQADPTTRRRYGGTGLGLAISKELAEGMGGHIGAESKLGHGSCFWFTIEAPAAPIVEAELEPRLGLRALVIAEDWPSSRALEKYLKRLGVRSRRAAMSDALATARQLDEPIDVLFVDERGDHDVLCSLVERILRGYATKACVVVAVVARRPKPELDDECAQKASTTLARPVRLNRLRRILEAVENGELDSGSPATESAPSALPKSGEGSVVADQQGDRERLKILVAEDSPVNVKVITRMLDRLGHEWAVVSDGREAAETRFREPHDLILMDCQMPTVDGYQATREIRRREEVEGRTRISIIALTANAMAGDRERCEEAGMDDYVAKPVDLDALSQALDRWRPPPRPKANSSPAAGPPPSRPS